MCWSLPDIRNETVRDQDSFSTLSTAALLNNFVNADNKEVNADIMT